MSPRIDSFGEYLSLSVKLVEIRDRATFIPAMIIRMWSDDPKERYLLERAGYSLSMNDILLCRIDGGDDVEAQIDPLEWGYNPRTMRVAHHSIVKRGWHNIGSGQVIDVEYILGETDTAKVSERITHANPT